MKVSISDKVAVCIVVVAGALAALPAWADPPKVGIVDPQRLLTESPQGKGTLAKLRAEFAPRERSLQAQAQALKAKNDTLQKNAATMSDDQRIQAEKSLRDGERDFERARGELQDDLTTRRNEEMSRLQKTLGEEVRNYAKAQNYDMVLNAEAVVYATPGYDITPAILAALQAHAGAAAHGAGAAHPQPPSH